MLYYSMTQAYLNMLSLFNFLSVCVPAVNCEVSWLFVQYIVLISCQLEWLWTNSEEFIMAVIIQFSEELYFHGACQSEQLAGHFSFIYACPLKVLC
jgi:hypothetical protein